MAPPTANPGRKPADKAKNNGIKKDLNSSNTDLKKKIAGIMAAKDKDEDEDEMITEAKQVQLTKNDTQMKKLLEEMLVKPKQENENTTSLQNVVSHWDL
jgi:hypothetical protein